MSEETQRTQTRSTGQHFARFSWMTFAIFVLVNTAGNATGLRVAAELIALGLMFVGVGCGITALVYISKDGRRGILIPAVIGIVLNGLFILIWVSNFMAA